ncbi:PR-1-like protein [Mycena latifolia]|nr:PR-1-like protein [Mycena latifolia]
MARLLSLALVLGLLPSGLAGPACAQKLKTTADCVLKCNTKWGFPGFMMGVDPWGSVMQAAGKSDAEWDNYVAKACGDSDNATSTTAEASSTTSSATAEATKLLHQGLGTQGVASTTSVSSTSTSSSTRSSSTFTTSTIRRTTSTTTSSSTKRTTTSTSTTPKATTTQKPTTTHTTTKAAQTTVANSFSGDDGDSGSDSNSSNSNTGSSSSSGGGGGDNGSRASDADVQAYLQAHNSIRSQHGAVPISWSNAAAVKAQQWADLCKNQHSGGTLGPLGENLAAGTGSFTIAKAVKAWTDEVSNYDPNNPQASHFTQVVWKASTQLGCAVQTCDGIFAGFGAAQYYVCEYSVQGNVEGEFGTNVQV